MRRIRPHTQIFFLGLICLGIGTCDAAIEAPVITAPVITTTSLPDGEVGKPYSQVLQASGGSGSYSWSKTAGELPPGLNFSSDGSISGTPTTGATYQFTITVASGGLTSSRTYSLRIIDRIATSITMSPTSLSFTTTGATQQLTATVKDQNGATISDATVTWSSSNTGVATVSASGSVTSVGDGTATITATSGSASATASVTVTLMIPTTITLSPTSLSFSSPGSTQQLTATVVDQNGTTISNPSVTWSTSNASVATVSSSGAVTSVGDGTATITATSGSVSATASVTVLVLVPTTITLSPTSLSFSSPGSTQQLTATVKDQNGTTISDATVTWTTSNASVATVSASGAVTAVAVGSATITATSGSASATASVTVTVMVPTTVTLSPTSLSFTSIGATSTLTATVKDQNGATMSGATVTWTTSNASVATVSSGVVTSVAAGTATITATSGSASATASVTVAVTQSFLQFDGVDDYVNIPDSDALNLTTYTVAAWFKADNPTAPGFIIARGESFGSDVMQYSLAVSNGFGSSSGKLGAWFETASDSDFYINTTTTINAGQWYFGVVTRSASGDYKLYLDGNLEASSTGTSSPGTPSHITTIGNRTQGHPSRVRDYEEHFDGAVKEAAIWDTALSAAQITALYNSGTPINASNNSGNYTSSSNLKGYWRLNEGTGSTASDLSDNGNDGTIHGATWGESGEVTGTRSQRSAQNTGRNQ